MNKTLHSILFHHSNLFLNNENTKLLIMAAIDASRQGNVQQDIGLTTQNKYDVPGLSTSGDLIGIQNSLNNVKDLIQKDIIEQTIISNDFRGYMKNVYQDNILHTETVTRNASSGWLLQGYADYNIDVPLGTTYIPKTGVMRLPLRCRKNDNSVLDDNMIPREHFIKHLITKIEIKNLTTSENINTQQEFETDMYDYVKNWYYNKEDYKHNFQEAGRRQELCESVGSRLKKDESNKRLTARLNSDEKKYWDAVEFVDIPLGYKNSFFNINEHLNNPIQIRVYFNTNDPDSLFEVVPKAAVKDTKSPCKVIFDEKKVPKLMLVQSNMTGTWIANQTELWKKNQLYNLGQYPKCYNFFQNVGKNDQTALVTFSGITETPEFIQVTLQSKTTEQHSTVYESSHEDRALGTIKELYMNNIQINGGSKSFFITVNDPIKIENTMWLYNSFRRFATGAPTNATNDMLINTDYIKNFPTYKEFVETTKTPVNGCYPCILDISKSKGSVDGTMDNPDELSPNMSLNVVFKKPLAEDMVLKVTVYTHGTYIIDQTVNGVTRINKT